MVPGTWPALLVLVVAVLPGAMFTYGFERQAGAFGATLADRVLRFVAVSVVFDLVYAWPAYLLYRAGWTPPPWDAPRAAVAWAVLVVALAAPARIGSTLGSLYVSRRTRVGHSLVRRMVTPAHEAALLRVILGPDPAPRAWDHFFAERPSAYLRVRLSDERWLGGLFASASYAGGFPQDGDLLLEQAWPVDDDGVFGSSPLGYAVYVPARSISYIEFVPAPRR